MGVVRGKGTGHVPQRELWVLEPPSASPTTGRTADSPVRSSAGPMFDYMDRYWTYPTATLWVLEPPSASLHGEDRRFSREKFCRTLLDTVSTPRDRTPRTGVTSPQEDAPCQSPLADSAGGQTGTLHPAHRVSDSFSLVLDSRCLSSDSGHIPQRELWVLRFPAPPLPRGGPQILP